MKIISETEFSIGVHFLPALFYNDVSGITDEEAEALEAFEAAQTIGRSHFHWDIVGDESEFTKCEVLGVYSDCATVRLYILET